MPSDQFAQQRATEDHPPPQHDEGLLARIKRKAAFWLASIIGALLIFVLIGTAYGIAGDLGLIKTDNWMTGLGLVVGLIASWWLFGQVMLRKFGYESVFD